MLIILTLFSKTYALIRKTYYLGYINKTNNAYYYQQSCSLIIRTTNQSLGDP